MKRRPTIREREQKRAGRTEEGDTIDVEAVSTREFTNDDDTADFSGLGRRLTFGALLAFLLFILYHNGAPLYVDWLWFHEVGYTSVFTTSVLTRSALYAAFSLIFFVVIYGNAVIARRLGPSNALRQLNERFGTEWGGLVERWLGRLLLFGSLFLALWAGRIGSDNWTHWLEFQNAVPFGVKDPIFHQDISFYLFRAPFYHALYGFAITTLLLSIVVVLILYFVEQPIEALAGLRNVRSQLRTQLLVLTALLAIVQAWGTHLNAFNILLSDNGIFTGAGYVDIHQRLFAYRAATGALLFTALACLLTIRRSDLRLPLVGIGAWLFSIIVLGGIWPGIVQKTSVDPNQFARESENLSRNILFTRQGFGLQSVQRVDNFRANGPISASQISANRSTLDSIRLWDYPYLAKVYSQTQTIKPYYRFESVAVGGDRVPNIDVDRYRIGGNLRQVMLAPREMDNTGLPEAAQTWQNRMLAYTHGYGIVMSPVNRTLDGDPDYYIQGFPPTSSTEAAPIVIKRPEIYYGTLAHNQVYVNTQQSEFDYPSTDAPPSQQNQNASSAQDHYTTYQGSGGIVIGDSYWKKLAFASALGDWNLLLANNLTAQTRVLYRRDIRDRLQTIAPFLQQDGDPYLVVDPDTGRQVWFIDCYTLSDRYPYSTPQQLMVSAGSYIAPNYIRNSVKATIDAYDGSVKLYVNDPNDPIIRTYMRIFPQLLRPLSELSPGLRVHIRYPEDLFRLQRAVYAVYHVEDPRVFYLKEDVWAVPTEPNAQRNPQSQTPPEQMEPYFVVMRLPDIRKDANKVETSNPSGLSASSDPNENPEPEFVLMSPLAPIKKEDQNILGWMCARCDGDHYGELVLYRFPQGTSVPGPSQIVQLINADRVISPQLSLLRQGGSIASLGNLLVIPFDQSLLYIAPLYVESSSSENKLPKLQKVIVAHGTNVAMADTLDKALEALFGIAQTNGTPRQSEPTKPEPQQKRIENLVERATQQYQSARARLKQEDLSGYAAQMKELEATLNALQKAVRNR